MSSYTRYESLSGRTVFVTGGATGIGADIVRAFAANEARTAFVDINEEAGRQVAEQTGALFMPCDITDTKALAASIEKTRDELGLIGVLVNNAANDERKPVGEVTPDYWDWSLAINLKAQFFAAQAVIPQMRELGGGSIINFASIAWRLGGNNLAHYCSAKAGAQGLTGALANELGADNIRVNAVEPGAVATERQIRLYYGSEERADELAKRNLIQRRLIGEDIAKAVLFLAADDSAMITRQTICVNGGLR